MSQTYTVFVKGIAMFHSATLGNAGTIHDQIKRRVPGVTVEVKPDVDTLTNPTYPEALAFLAAKGFTVLDKSGNPPAEPEKVAPVRNVTARTRATAAKAPATRAPRKKVAAASK